MTMIEKAEIIQEVADAVGGEICDDYSGRGMFGDTYIGVVCDNPQTAIEEATERGLRGASQESMGRQSIVYWPRVKRESPNAELCGSAENRKALNEI